MATSSLVMWRSPFSARDMVAAEIPSTRAASSSNSSGRSVLTARSRAPIMRSRGRCKYRPEMSSLFNWDVRLQGSNCCCATVGRAGLEPAAEGL